MTAKIQKASDFIKGLTPIQRRLLKAALLGEMSKLEEEEEDFVRMKNRTKAMAKRVDIDEMAILIQILLPEAR